MFLKYEQFGGCAPKIQAECQLVETLRSNLICTYNVYLGFSVPLVGVNRDK